ncbi:hypothetical protein V501_01778 [Pseudogymnoascus sp. VKM F-4519 (FW-2642)]|nr:hypothetical protein V501_01778 [Pseudogymnoascus sp. VKM F-4519 (FW-2642)]
MYHLSLPFQPGMNAMSPHHLCAARSPPFIVDTADAPALPPLPEFEDKWPSFLLWPPSSPNPSPPPGRIQHRRLIYSRQQTMPPPTLQPPRRPKHARNNTSTAYDVRALASISPTEHLFIISPSNDAPSLSDPSTYSSSEEEDEDDDSHASVTTLWDTYYNLPPNPNTSTTNPSPSSKRHSPIYEIDPSTMAPPFPPRSASRTSQDPSKPPPRLTPRSQTAPPLHFSPSLSLFPPIPRTHAPRPLISPCAPPIGLTEKSVWEHEEEGGSRLKGVKARFYVGGASGVQGGRRRSAGEIVKSIFGGWHEKGGKDAKSQ